MRSPVLRRRHSLLLLALLLLVIGSILGSTALAGFVPGSGGESMRGTTYHGQVPSAETVYPINNTSPAQPQSAYVAIASCKECGVVESIQLLQRPSKNHNVSSEPEIDWLLGQDNGLYFIGLGRKATCGLNDARKVSASSSSNYLIEIRMADGTYQSICQHHSPRYSIGDQVRVVIGRTTSI